MSMIRQKTEDQDFDLLFKIIIVGDSGVGKTNLLTRYSKGEFNFESKPTIGVEFTSKNIEYESKIIKAQLWDTAGQERYRSITKAYYKGAMGAMIVFDITRKQSFENISKWYDEIKQYGDENMVVMLLGNKSDLTDERMVTIQEGQDLANKLNIGFIETSAFTQDNVDQAFDLLTKGK